MSAVIAMNINTSDSQNVFLATDSRSMAANGKDVVSDATLKLFQVAPAVFYAGSGGLAVIHEQVRLAAQMAATGVTDLHALADYIDARSSAAIQRELEIYKKRLDPVHDEDRLTGKEIVLGYVLVGYSASDGCPAVLTRAFRLTGDRITSEETYSSKVSAGKFVVAGFRGEPLNTLQLDWSNGAVGIMEQFLNHLRRVEPLCGGPIQLACVAAAGGRWIHEPPSSETAVDSFGVHATLGGITNAYLAAASVGASNLQNDAITVANASSVIQALAIVDSLVGSVGLNKLAATTTTQGTAIFTADAVFSRGSGNPLIDIAAAGLTLFSNTVSGTGGDTTKPYVQIEASGLGLFGPSGSVSLQSTGVLVANSGNAVLVSATGVSISGPPSNNLTINSSGITISASSTGPTATLTGSALTLSNSGASVVVNATSVVMQGATSNSEISLDSSGNAVFSNATGQTTISGKNASIPGQLSLGALYWQGTYNGSATAGGITVPATCLGFVEIYFGALGANVKIPVYAS